VKSLLNSRRLRESLDPTLRGYLTERPETTTSCGLDPTLKGHPTERPETTTSCGLDPTLKGHPTERPETTTSCGLNPRAKGYSTKRAERTEGGPESLNVLTQDFHEKNYEVASNFVSCKNKLA
jgi:hypothetical protein